jgi:hypothetical protein
MIGDAVYPKPGESAEDWGKLMLNAKDKLKKTILRILERELYIEASGGDEQSAMHTVGGIDVAAEAIVAMFEVTH